MHQNARCIVDSGEAVHAYLIVSLQAYFEVRPSNDLLWAVDAKVDGRGVCCVRERG